MAVWASLHSDAWRGWKADAVRAGEGELVCVCVCVCVRARVWVNWFILLGVFPIAAHTNKLEESSHDETPTLCQPVRKKGSPITYAATTPLYTQTQTHPAWVPADISSCPDLPWSKYEELDEEAR